MKRTAWVILLGTLTGGCATPVMINSSPAGARLYLAPSHRGPWEVKAERLPASVSISSRVRTWLAKAVKYGYYDAGPVSVSQILSSGTYTFEMREAQAVSSEVAFDLPDQLLLRSTVPLEERPIAAVLSFSAKGKVEVDLAATVSDVVRSDLVQSGAFSVVERENVDKVLQELRFQMTGATDPSSAAQIGQMLNASRVLTGSVASLGGRMVVTISVVDVTSGKVIYSDNQQFSSPEQTKKVSVALVNRIVKSDLNRRSPVK